MPNLKLTRTQATVLAHALNSCRLSTFSQQQQEHLPELGRKLSEFLADNEPEEPKLKPGRPKQAKPFNTPERINKTGPFAVLREI
jgi:hypothetical protein